MFGLIVLVIIGLYLLISVGVVRWAISYAKKNGKSVKRWGWGAALVMYLLVFWDWIPTVVAHQYYCSTEAGFWVYKTPEQWKKENPGVMETLHTNEPRIHISSQDDNGNNWSSIDKLNQRINVTSITQDYGAILTNLRRHTIELSDSKNSNVLVKYVDFSSSGRKRRADWAWKSWLETEHCNDSGEHRDVQYEEFENQFTGSKK